MNAQMFMGTTRGTIETDSFRCRCIFNFEDFYDDSRQSFGTIQIVNDELLVGGATRSYQSGHGIFVVIPMIGALAFSNEMGEQIVGTGEILQVSAAYAFSITNPYREQQVNFLVIGIDQEVADDFYAVDSLQKKPNKVQLAFNLGQCKGFIGMFDARKESDVKISDANGLFAFVINGAFEFQERLLETRDALVISDCESVEFEALSGNAILLLIETEL